MKVLLLNGSPHENGCTYTALKEVADTLNKENVETEILWIGNKGIRGCCACGACAKTGECICKEDVVNEAIKKMQSADGLVVGSPVYYASANGSLVSFMDRFFHAGSGFAYKPAAAVTSARRAGTTSTLDDINKYFTISQMPVVSSGYWNMVHGSCAEDVKKDLEGLQTMRILGRNMTWLLKCIEAGKTNHVAMPEKEDKIKTNFIR